MEIKPRHHVFSDILKVAVNKLCHTVNARKTFSDQFLVGTVKKSNLKCVIDDKEQNIRHTGPKYFWNEWICGRADFTEWCVFSLAVFGRVQLVVQDLLVWIHYSSKCMITPLLIFSPCSVLLQFCPRLWTWLTSASRGRAVGEVMVEEVAAAVKRTRGGAPWGGRAAQRVLDAERDLMRRSWSRWRWNICLPAPEHLRGSHWTQVTQEMSSLWDLRQIPGVRVLLVLQFWCPCFWFDPHIMTKGFKMGTVQQGGGFTLVCYKPQNVFFYLLIQELWSMISSR